MGDDEPIEHICKLVRDLHLAGCEIVYVSGRSDECRNATVAWFARHDLPLSFLFMRKQGDHRDDDIVKAEILAELRQLGFEPTMAFEDRNRVVKQWRENGVPCAQVAGGDF